MKLALALAATAFGGCATSAAPDAVDAVDQVRTPFGYFHPSCVLATDPSGNRPADVAACAHPHQAVSPDSIADAETDGWKSSEWFQTTPLSYVSATWTVPAPPRTQSDAQTLYYFPGLEPPSYDDIVQPVLAWDGFSDNAWTMTSWNCCENGNVWHSTPISVSPGDAVWGDAAGSDCGSDGTCSSWTIVSGDTTTDQTTTLAATTTETFTAAQGGVLETYGVAACSDLTTSVKFDHVEVKGVNGKLVTATWSPDIAAASPSCDYGAVASVHGDASTVTIRDKD
jgi:hypothetical protein